jgi:hypothetical protein
MPLPDLVRGGADPMAEGDCRKFDSKRHERDGQDQPG